MRWPLGALVVAYGLAAFAGGLTLQLAVFMPMENAGLDSGTGVWLYGLYGVTAAVMGLALSFSLDVMPALRVTIPALVIGALARVLLVVAGSHAPSLFVLLGVVVPTCDTIAGQAMLLGSKRLLDFLAVVEHDTDGEARQRAFLSLVYTVGNAMMIGEDVLYDVLRHVLPVAGANQAAALASAAACAVAAGVMAVAQWRWVTREDWAPPIADVALGARPVTAALASPEFRRFFVFSMLLTGVRVLYRNFDTTLSLFLVHVYGPEAHFALVQALNPLLILVLVPLLTWRLLRVRDYPLFVAGTLTSGAAPLLAALFLAATGGAAVYGDVLGMMVVFTVGEAVWSPRLASYALSASPRGATALFLATSTLPGLLAKGLATLLSFALTEYVCPAAGPCDGVAVWATLAAVALTTPLALRVGMPWLDKHA